MHVEELYRLDREQRWARRALGQSMMHGRRSQLHGARDSMWLPSIASKKHCLAIV
jgi:hypothetical protein